MHDDGPPEIILALYDEPEDMHLEISFDEEVSATYCNLRNSWKLDEDHRNCADLDVDVPSLIERDCDHYSFTDRITIKNSCEESSAGIIPSLVSMHDDSLAKSYEQYTNSGKNSKITPSKVKCGSYRMPEKKSATSHVADDGAKEKSSVSIDVPENYELSHSLNS